MKLTPNACAFVEPLITGNEENVIRPPKLKFSVFERVCLHICTVIGKGFPLSSRNTGAMESKQPPAQFSTSDRNDVCFGYAQQPTGRL